MSRIIEVVPHAFANVPVLSPPSVLWYWLAFVFGVVSWTWFDVRHRVN